MAILLTKECWMNSQLSIARHYGRIRINGKEFDVMHPAFDLVDADFLKYYKELGRDKFIEILQKHPKVSKTAMEVYMNSAITPKKRKADNLQLSIF